MKGTSPVSTWASPPGNWELCWKGRVSEVGDARGCPSEAELG